jgi:hypothetical protein
VERGAPTRTIAAAARWLPSIAQLLAGWLLLLLRGACACAQARGPADDHQSCVLRPLAGGLGGWSPGCWPLAWPVPLVRPPLAWLASLALVLLTRTTRGGAGAGVLVPPPVAALLLLEMLLGDPGCCCW